MSLATNIKDFADLLHNIYAQQLSSLEGSDMLLDGVLPLAIPKTVILQQACLYGVKSFISGIFYVLSFQWLRDFSYLPLISPEIGNESSIHHDTFLSEPFSYLFSFAKNGVNLSPYMQNEAWQEGAKVSATTGVSEDLYVKQGFTTIFNTFLKSDQLVAGFVNSFFFSFPFSLPHLVSLRRMFSQGVAAAAASIFGTVAAHALVVMGVIYGIRFLIIPYYSFQPLTFLIGLVTIAIVITEFVKEKRVYLVPLTHYPALVRIGVLNFVLSLCESATLFHDLHHLTLNQQISYLSLYESQNALDSFLLHTAYLITFVFGHILFSLGFCYLLLKSTEKMCSFTGWTLPQTARRINRGLLIGILTLTFSCFPYYGLDYLFTKSAGFLPEDPAYRNTIFSPTQVRSRNRHFKSRAPATKNSKTPLELDLNYFDRGMYLNAPKEEKTPNDPDLGETTASSVAFGGSSSFLQTGASSAKERGDPESKKEGGDSKLTKEESDLKTANEAVPSYDPVLTFEELNYQGESAWLMRHERARRLPEEQDSKKESVFQKPKTHFKQLRLNQDNKRAEAALREFSQIGSISEWKEGSRPGEKLSLYDENLSNRSTRLSTEFRKKTLLKDLAFEKEIAANYEKSFASPFGEEADGTPPDLLPVENIIKKRYRLNPVYRALLQTDIDFFIARQPAHYRITQNQEASLFKKRQLLERYYNSIRYYSPVESVGFTKRYLPHLGPSKSRSDGDIQSNKNLFAFGSASLKEGKQNESYRGDTNFYKTKLYPPTKSFSQTIYHQQFKGTLNTVKRFFKLTFDEQQNPNKNRVLSYDQLLYQKRNPSSSSRSSKSSGFKDLLDEQYHPSLHEELDLEKVSPFIEESNSSPIYAGWDDKARRFVITNRFNLLD